MFLNQLFYNSLGFTLCWSHQLLLQILLCFDWLGFFYNDTIKQSFLFSESLQTARRKNMIPVENEYLPGNHIFNKLMVNNSATRQSVINVLAHRFSQEWNSQLPFKVMYAILFCETTDVSKKSLSLSLDCVWDVMYVDLLYPSWWHHSVQDCETTHRWHVWQAYSYPWQLVGWSRPGIPYSC